MRAYYTSHYTSLIIPSHSHTFSPRRHNELALVLHLHTDTSTISLKHLSFFKITIVEKKKTQHTTDEELSSLCLKKLTGFLGVPEEGNISLKCVRLSQEGRKETGRRLLSN